MIGDRSLSELVVEWPTTRLQEWIRPTLQPRVLALLATTLGIGFVTFGLRAFSVDRSFEIHVDEAIYIRISQNVANSLRLSYDLGGHGPFFLHPPLFFFIEAGFIKLLAPGGDAVRQIIIVRYLAALFGALSGVILFLICRRMLGWLPGLAAAAVFAVEPFTIRMDSRNFLEPSAMCWVLLGLCTIVYALDRCDGTQRSPVQWRMMLAGAAFGAALLTNEPAAFVTLLPLAVCAVSGVISKRDALFAAACALAIYAIYPLTVAATGNFDDFKHQKLAGVGRFVGLTVETGFNGKAGPSFLSAVAANWQQFAPTYALLGVGMLATIWLVFQRDAWSRLAACWSGSAYCLQAYSVLFGTNEEQYFYYVAILAIVSIMVAAKHALVRPPMAAAARRQLKTLAVPLSFVLFLLGLTSYIALDHYVTSDNGYGAVAWSIASALDRGPDTITLPQFAVYYLLLLPVVAIAFAARPTTNRKTSAIEHRARLRAAATLLLVLVGFISVSSYVAIDRYTTPDNGYRHLLAYLGNTVPSSTRIAGTSATEVILLREAGYGVTDMPLATGADRPKVTDPAMLIKGRPEYVTVATRLVDEKYGVGTPELVQWLDRHGQVVFRFRGPSTGELRLYRIVEGPEG